MVDSLKEESGVVGLGTNGGLPFKSHHDSGLVFSECISATQLQPQFGQPLWPAPTWGCNLTIRCNCILFNPE